MGRRHRDSQGQHDTRGGQIRLATLFHGTYSLVGSRTILLVDCCGARVFGVRVLLGGYVHTCYGLGLANHGLYLGSPFLHHENTTHSRPRHCPHELGRF